MPIKSETELYQPIKQFLEKQEYVVRGEVGNCDLVAVRGDEEPIVVELKKTFNLPLLIQGIERQKHSVHVYLAVEMPASERAPHGLKWSELVRVCRLLGLGLLTVRFYTRKAPQVFIHCEPGPYAPRRNHKAGVRLIREFNGRSGDYNLGGSSQRKIVTAYREKALQCAQLMLQHGPLSTKQLREMTGNMQVAGLLQKNAYQWFERVKIGVYQLTPEGERALQTYAHVIHGQNLHNK